MLTISATSQTENGIHPVNRHHLRQIADLIELCFADNMDRAGRAVVQDMRLLAGLGWGLGFIQHVDRMLKGLMQGFVWLDDNRVVGNVSIFPAGYDHTWVIANVAVHPDYRNHGIARRLCQAAINRIVEWRGHGIILQVDEHNEPAQKVYYRLGFTAQRAFTRWQWNHNRYPPAPLPDMPNITYRSLQDWRSAYQLVNLQRPNERGGLGWMRPTRESDFRPSLWRSLTSLFDPTRRDEWITRGSNERVEGMVINRLSFGSSSVHFDLLVHPDQQGKLEEPLVNYTLRRANDQLRGAFTDHPADDQIANEVFQLYHFRSIRTLIHMRWNP